MSREELNDIIAVLAKAEQEAVGSMGDDTPMAVLSQKVRSPFDYFRQQFAQVTNPPIDSLRERIVMSLQTNIGRESSLFDMWARSTRRHVIMNSPVLSQRKLRQLLEPDDLYQGPPRVHRSERRRKPDYSRSARQDLRRRGAKCQGRQAHHHAVGPLPRKRQAAGARTARYRRGASSSRAMRLAHATRTSSSKPASHGTRIISPA